MQSVSMWTCACSVHLLPGLQAQCTPYLAALGEQREGLEVEATGPALFPVTLPSPLPTQQGAKGPAKRQANSHGQSSLPHSQSRRGPFPASFYPGEVVACPRSYSPHQATWWKLGVFLSFPNFGEYTASI